MASVGVSLRDSLLVGAIVFVAAAVGMLSQAVIEHSTFWPTEALLIGVLVRNPSLARPASWVAAFCGYLAAGLLGGGDLAVVLWVSAVGILSAFIGVTLFQQLPEGDRRLQLPRSIVYMFAIVLVAAFVNAMIGGRVVAISEPSADWTGLTIWLSSDLANYLLVLPIVLTAPAGLPRSAWQRLEQVDLASLAPVTALMVSAVIGVMVGGPGAIAFPIPALIWCALTYSVFSTVLLSATYSVWKMSAFAMGAISIDPGVNFDDTMASVRLGIALLTLGPLAVASINAAREDLLETLDRSANYDYLTGSLARSAFMDRGQRLCEALQPTGTIAVLALDIDQFKNVNDSFGHAAGDRILVAFAAAVTRVLRPGDLFGRLGGEEFAIIMPSVDDAEALAIAERIRDQVEAAGVTLDDGQHVSITVSIGLVNWRCRIRTSIDTALASADQALYAAKDAGRNRVVVIDEP
jgi:diguanylate cyclase (GGDEF)-like protein